MTETLEMKERREAHKVIGRAKAILQHKDGLKSVQ
jgi:AmiR/NasT family two-component response regulator